MNPYQNNNCFQSNTGYGPNPLIVNIDRATKINTNFRAALWTGENLQVTLMSIPVGGEIGVEMHKDTDQFLRIEQGFATIRFGNSKCDVKDVQRINSHNAVIIPAGIWHNIVNCGNIPLKLYSIYAPPHHPFGTVHKTAKDALAEH